MNFIGLPPWHDRRWKSTAEYRVKTKRIVDKKKCSGNRKKDNPINYFLRFLQWYGKKSISSTFYASIFWYKSKLSSFSLVTFSFVIFGAKISYKNRSRKTFCWWNWPKADTKGNCGPLWTFNQAHRQILIWDFPLNLKSKFENSTPDKNIPCFFTARAFLSNFTKTGFSKQTYLHFLSQIKMFAKSLLFFVLLFSALDIMKASSDSVPTWELQVSISPTFYEQILHKNYVWHVVLTSLVLPNVFAFYSLYLHCSLKLGCLPQFWNLMIVFKSFTRSK